jgi:ATP-binding cassette subfamily A (ABC1) protein 1
LYSPSPPLFPSELITVSESSRESHIVCACHFCVELIFRKPICEGAATYLNLFGDLMYRSIADTHFASNPQTNTPEKISISVSNHPLPVTAKYREEVGRALAFGATTIIMCAYAFVASAVVAFIVLERDEQHNSKHQQLLCGASVTMFW